MSFPLVIVEWEDATNFGNWAPIAEAQEFKDVDFDYHIRSVGYLIRSDAECVIVAARMTANEQACGLVERIPRGMVTSIRRLRQHGALED